MILGERGAFGGLKPVDKEDSDCLEIHLCNQVERSELVFGVFVGAAPLR